MNETPRFSFDVTGEKFAQFVLHNSAQVPVLVDFWAPWCGPCQSLMPLLSRLAEAYDGQFLLAKVNIDEEQALAMQYQVRSVPTVKLFRHGEVVDEFMGALPEGEVRRFIDAHIERESDRLLPAIFERFEAGEQEEALAALRDLKAQEADNESLSRYELQMLVAMGRNEEAQRLLQTLPLALLESEEIKALRGQLQLSAMAGNRTLAELEQAIAANPGDSEARYLLGLQRSAAGDYEGALEALLELLRRDRNFQEGAAQKAMLMIFDTLGGSGELVSRYRRLMASALY